MRLLVSISFCLCLPGQPPPAGTFIPAYQIHNPNQVQVGPTPCKGTCISQVQIQQITFTNGTMPDGISSENTDVAIGATCTTNFYGIRYADGTQVNFMMPDCN